MTERCPLPPINFAALAQALLDRVRSVLPAWLPGGAFKGHEYQVHSVWRPEKTPSLSVSVGGERAGCWADFGGEHRGRDLISLYAAIHGLDQGAAAIQIAHREGLESVAGVMQQVGGAAIAPPPQPPPPPPAARREPESEGWTPQIPVPPHAPAATFRHPKRSSDTITHTAAYRSDGHLLGYVVRFRTSDGGKETLPYTWCTSARDGASRWHWKQWDDPRPLYLPGGNSPDSFYRSGRVRPTVIVVEGERKADLLQALLDAAAPDVYMVVSWPGGSKAWKKAMWEWLAGCIVLLWPDCDGKRELLTKAERDQCPDDAARLVVQQSKPLLPAHKQVGMVAMLGIGALLRDEHMCTVSLLPIPAPGEVSDGWDCADAIEVDGWDANRVLAFFASAGPLPSPEPESTPSGKPGAGAGHSRAGGGGGKSPPSGDGPPPAAGEDAEDGGDPDGDEFARHLLFLCSKFNCKVHDIAVNRKLVIAALRKSVYLASCLGFNELTNAPCTRFPWPWRSEAGPLADADDLRLGDFLCRTYGLKAASRASLAEAIDTVADERHYHPVRDWLNGLEHDGKTRIDKWLIHVLGMDPDTLPLKRLQYLEKVGRFLLLGLVARVMRPGCKFDYSPVFEGLPGMGKSTLVKTLVGKDFFSDTHFDIGVGKDGFEQFQGLWAYELSELTALRKADSEQVKQFFSSEVDRYRGAYGKYVQPHPRQLVIFCSTNKKQYLYDLTGNRRFWPVTVLQPINIAWIEKYRAQLFAEALQLFNAGAQYYPTMDEEADLFVPEQRRRLVETAVQSKLYELLTRDGVLSSEGKPTEHTITVLTKFVTLDRLIAHLGADAAKSSSLLEGQVRGWLEANGWTYGRESTGQRRRGYRQPERWPPPIVDDEEGDTPPRTTPPGAGGIEDGAADDAPF